MIELLKMCGFEAQEIESELPRVEKVFEKVGITAEDIEEAKQRLAKYYDIELQGVRKILRLYIRELLNLVLAREEGKTKILYHIMASQFATIGSACVSKSKKVYVIGSGDIFNVVLGCIFGKMVPILEAAEEKWLKAGAVTHCANPKTLVGLLALDLIPKPDLVVTSGFLCDTAPKTIDLLHELYDIPTCSFDTCQDRETGDYLETKRIIDLAAKSMRRVTERVQKIVGFEITDDMLSEVPDARKDLTAISAKLHNLLRWSDPLPLSATHAILLQSLNQLAIDATNLPGVIDAVDTLYGELQERVNKGVGVVEKGAPRIIALNPPHYADPRLEHLIGEVGIALIATEGGGLRAPLEEPPKDPYEVTVAGLLQSSLCASTGPRARIIVEECKRLNVDGVLDRYHAGCRTVTGDAVVVSDIIRKELGLPVLLFEWEGFDPRVYNHEQYKGRLEVFKTMLKT
ncbi:2-hydroxyacyl-CoA dehydratase [Chloroflexota bacterium]